MEDKFYYLKFRTADGEEYTLGYNSHIFPALSDASGVRAAIMKASGTGNVNAWQPVDQGDTMIQISQITSIEIRQTAAKL